MLGQDDTYKEIRTFNFPGAVVRVHIPDIDEEERNRRMKQIYKAAAELLSGSVKNEKK